MLDKLYDGEFQIYDVNGLYVLVLRSAQKTMVDVYVFYRKYNHLMFVYDIPFEEFDIDDCIESIGMNFVNIMRTYFDDVDKLEE